MKRRDFEKLLKENGYWLEEHGANHDKWTNGIKTDFVPRHRELKEPLVRAIIRRLGLK